MKTGSHLQHGGDAAPDIYFTLGGSGDPADDLQERGFPGTVCPDNPDAFPAMNVKIHAVQRPEELAGAAGVCADALIRIVPAAPAGPPGLQILLKRLVIDETESILLFDSPQTEREILFIHSPILKPCP